MDASWPSAAARATSPERRGRRKKPWKRSAFGTTSRAGRTINTMLTPRPPQDVSKPLDSKRSRPGCTTRSQPSVLKTSSPASSPRSCSAGTWSGYPRRNAVLSRQRWRRRWWPWTAGPPWITCVSTLWPAGPRCPAKKKVLTLRVLRPSRRRLQRRRSEHGSSEDAGREGLGQARRAEHRGRARPVVRGLTPGSRGDEPAGFRGPQDRRQGRAPSRPDSGDDGPQRPHVGIRDADKRQSLGEADGGLEAKLRGVRHRAQRVGFHRAGHSAHYRA